MTKCLMIAALTFGMAAVLVAETPKTAKPKLTPEERAARMETMMRKTGGIVEKQGDGMIFFVNCQNKVNDEEVKKRFDRIQYVLKYPMTLKRGEWKFGDGKPAGCDLAIFIIDDEKLPMSLVAPESGWGVVNVSAVSLGHRFSKELTRVTCLVLGQAHSGVKTSPMQTIRTAADLDKCQTDGFTFDMAQSINLNLRNLGVTAPRKTSYKRACEEGWAPAPTNEYQKAIWDKTHAVPKNPMKIEFDPKKGK